MNDNRVDPREKMIGQVLASTVVIEEHLTRGLQAMLAANGVSTSIRDGVAEFIQPVLDMLAGIEGDVVRGARRSQATSILGYPLVPVAANQNEQTRGR